MSNEKQETIDDIVAEMRTKAECAKPYDDGIVIMLTVLTDRLEAAAKRERLLSKPPENDNSAPVVSTVDNKPGNAAAMHEALEAARDLLLPQCNGGTAFAKACGETVNKIMDTLAKPPRNCDLFGGNYKMLHTAWWDWTCSPSGTNPDGTVKLTFGEWLLKIVDVRHA